VGSRASRYKPRHRRTVGADALRRRVIGSAVVAVAAISATLAIARPLSRAADATAGASSSTPAARAEPHAALLAGAYWQKLSPAERQAYLTGFVAGAAAEQARSRAEQSGRATDSAAVSSGAIDALRSARALHFRFAPHVYSAQVDDFYTKSDRAATPIVDAMIFFNREMLKQQQGVAGATGATSR
jgi:hypothetical protein